MLNYVKIAKNLNNDLTKTNVVINVRKYNGATVVFAVNNSLKNLCGPVSTKKYKGKIISNYFLTSAATDTDFDAIRKELDGACGPVTTKDWKGRIIDSWYLISASTAAKFDTMRKKLVGA